MNRKYRKTFIAGNWKMNMTMAQTKDFAEEFKAGYVKGNRCEVLICVPSVNISGASRAFKDCSRISVGAQTIHYEEQGAFTGEVSAPMLKELGIKYTIVGHSERRTYYNETDMDVNKKVHAALSSKINPIVCVGESLEQREMGVTMEYIAYQVKAALNGVSDDLVHHIIFAYEPVWAIGTGKTATAEEAEEVCASIRATIRKLYGARTARAVSILYGGSMNENNARELLLQPDIDGGLIGGASLNAQKLLSIVRTAQEIDG